MGAALECLQAGGPAALTMRGVAVRLETGPASLYAWVRDQRQLQVLVLDAIAAEVKPPDGTDPADDQIVALLLAYAECLHGYPGAAQLALAAPPTGPASLDLLERGLGLLEQLGLDSATSVSAIDSLVLLVTATVAEQESRAADETPGSIPELYEQAVRANPSEVRPHLAAALQHLYAVPGEQRLAWSIRTFIRGLGG